MKKVLMIVVSMLLLAGVFAGCTQDPADSTFNWNLEADPLTLDPALNGASDGGHVINQTFEPLVRDQAGVIVPGVAESWETSADGLTVTFHLRKSNWSDGEPVTANDFVYGMKRGIDPATASEYAWIWEYTNVVGAYAATSSGDLDSVGIEAIDDYTLQISLTAPTAYLVSLMAFYHFMPTRQDIVEAPGNEDGAWAKNPEQAVSNGPFVLTSYTIGEGLTLEKNEEYWNKKNVGISVINTLFITEASTAYTAFLSGEIDFLFTAPPAEVPKLIAEDSRFYIFPRPGFYYYDYNMDLEIWQDVRVRKALALAIDRELICETMGVGNLPSFAPVPPGMFDADGNDFNEMAGDYGFSATADIEQAQALLAEAGFPNGEGFPEFVISYNTSEAHKLVAELIQEMFKTNLNITCTLENQEWAVFQDTRKEGDYEMARGGWITDFIDPSGLLAIFQLDNAYNDPNYKSPEFNATMAIANSAPTPAEHFAALYEAQDILMGDMPILPIYFYTNTMLVSDALQGWTRGMLGTVDFSHASINK